MTIEQIQQFRIWHEKRLIELNYPLEIINELTQARENWLSRVRTEGFDQISIKRLPWWGPSIFISNTPLTIFLPYTPPTPNFSVGSPGVNKTENMCEQNLCVATPTTNREPAQSPIRLFTQSLVTFSNHIAKPHSGCDYRFAPSHRKIQLDFPRAHNPSLELILPISYQSCISHREIQLDFSLDYIVPVFTLRFASVPL